MKALMWMVVATVISLAMGQESNAQTSRELTLDTGETFTLTLERDPTQDGGPEKGKITGPDGCSVACSAVALSSDAGNYVLVSFIKNGKLYKLYLWPNGSITGTIYDPVEHTVDIIEEGEWTGPPFED